jgi:CO/xanthine dehydrogenase Mo-binding subunit
MDELAERLGIDPLELRLRNALGVGQATATGHVLKASAGLSLCIEALRPAWREARAAAEEHNRGAGVLRRGVGIGCMWYGIGNTSMTNPSTMRVALGRDGTLTLYNGAVDIGQGSNIIMVQICAEALGVPATQIRVVMGDTDRTADAGKTSASRQAFVSGNAAKAAGEDLRRQILRLAGAGPEARIEIDGGTLTISDGDAVQSVMLSSMPVVENDEVLVGTGIFDPPTTPLDADGQGEPYATYGFAAQLAEVEVDVELGTVWVLKITAAHDVGKAINPTQVEGQIHGGIAQGIGLALMEEYLPGRTENLHDYLIPTIGDVPDIECILVEAREPLGPFGAKGIGEQALIPTAPAILNAIHDATGVRIRRVPATPDRVRAAILAARQNRD